MESDFLGASIKLCIYSKESTRSDLLKCAKVVYNVSFGYIVRSS